MYFILPSCAIDPLHVCGNAANLEYRTIIFFTEAKIYFVLSSRLAAFPQTRKGSIDCTGRQNSFYSFQSLVFVLTQLHNGRCSSLPLSAKFDCAVAHQNVSLLATAHHFKQLFVLLVLWELVYIFVRPVLTFSPACLLACLFVCLLFVCFVLFCLFCLILSYLLPNS